MESNQVWTLEIKSGTPFQLRYPRTPLLQHDGILSLWKVFCSEKDVQELKRVIEAQSESVVVCYTEQQSFEQSLERKERLGITD